MAAPQAVRDWAQTAELGDELEVDGELYRRTNGMIPYRRVAKPGETTAHQRSTRARAAFTLAVQRQITQEAALSRAELGNAVGAAIAGVMAGVVSGELAPVNATEAAQLLNAMTRLVAVMQVDAGQAAGAAARGALEQDHAARKARLAQLVEMAEDAEPAAAAS